MACWKEKRRVMHRYDLTAEIYETRYAEEQKAKYEKALEKTELGSCNILDVGCGTGLFFSYVAFKDGLVLGVDISRRLLLKAKERAGLFANVFLVQADADHLPFESQVFCTVFGFTVLQNMPRPMETLDEFKRVTSVGGVIVVTGLKKAFSLGAFMDFLESVGLRVVSFVNEEVLKCYIAITTKD